MAKRTYPGKKRWTREHVIADLGVNYVERQALLCGFTVERSAHDYGIDVSIHTFTRRGEVENGELRVQVKASDRVRRLAGGRYLYFRVKKADLLHWLQELLPVILVVYDLPADRGYYLHVQEHFANLSGFDAWKARPSVGARIPCGNIYSTRGPFAKSPRPRIAWSVGSWHRADNMTKPVPYGALEEILLGLGFTRKEAAVSQILLEHPASGCVLFFRPYRAEERVEEIKLASVRRFLDEFGILDQDRFDNLLSASAA